MVGVVVLGVVAILIVGAFAWMMWNAPVLDDEPSQLDLWDGVGHDVE